MGKKAFAEWESVNSCDLCNSTNLKHYYSGPNVSIMQCQDCKYFFTNPRPTLQEIADSYSQDDFYDGWLKEDKGRLKMWQKRANRVIAQKLLGKNILDYSAGIGTFLHLLKLKGFNVFGTEISDSAKKIAKSKFDIELLNDADFSNDKSTDFFDLITAWHVVEHVHSPSKLIKWFHKLLKPGGVLVIAVPNIDHHPLKRFFKKEIEGDTVFSPMTPGTELHLSHFSHKTLTEFLKGNGFTIEVNSIDDHYPTATLKNRIRYWVTYITFCLTKKDKSGAMFIVARKNK
jgi:2-polyprenyl-3-methyl-5-hydroxy-6-metoxy-1,4-benzoquinol methylase